MLNDDVTLRAMVEGGVHASTGSTVSKITDRFTLNNKIRGFDIAAPVRAT